MTKLPQQAIKDLGLEGLTQMLETEIPKNAKFTGVGMAQIEYAAEVQKSEHYLLKNDPSITKGDYKGIRVDVEIPEKSTHYFVGACYILGPDHCQMLREVVPIVFFNSYDGKRKKKDAFAEFHESCSKKIMQELHKNPGRRMDPLNDLYKRIDEMRAGMGDFNKRMEEMHNKIESIIYKLESSDH